MSVSRYKGWYVVTKAHKVTFDNEQETWVGMGGAIRSAGERPQGSSAPEHAPTEEEALRLIRSTIEKWIDEQPTSTFVVGGLGTAGSLMNGPDVIAGVPKKEPA